MVEFDVGQEDDKFRRTTSVRTLDNGEIELNTTVDGQDKTITEASVRRHLKLADTDNISTLPITKIFEQLALMGKTKTRTRRMGHRIPQSNVSSSVANEAITKQMHDGLGRATTTASSLEAEQGSGKISKTQTKATPSRPSSSRTSLEGGPGCHVTMGVVVFRLGLKGYLTCPINPPWGYSKKGRMIKEINEDENVKLVQSSKQGEVHETARHRMESDDTSSPQKDDVKTSLVKILVNIKKSAAKDKGKPIMHESEPLKIIKKKEIMQISLDEEIAQRFYEEEQAHILMNEEYAQQVQAQWMLFDNTMESIRNFVPMESEGQIADSKAGEGSSKEAKQVVKESSKKDGGILKRKTSKAREDKDKRQKKHDDLEKLTVIDYVEVIFDSKKGDMKILFELVGDDTVWKNHHSQELIEWKLYDSGGVQSLMLGEVKIHMLVEKKYPLPQDTLTRILQWKLHVNYNVTEMAYELLRFIKAQLNQ
nr:hypothetical protein [Tanacetum cinerariifolium]